MKIEEVKKCSFQNWYSDFEKITMKSIILPLPSGFAEYILKDGIVLPENSNLSYEVGSTNSDESDSEVDWNNPNCEEAEPPYFPDFDEEITNAIQTLGGKVFPKLNWSSPRDASWITFNSSCCCNTVPDIYLLLKSSDFIIHDLTKAYENCEDYIKNENSTHSLSHSEEEFYLVLRKWVEIDTSGEFRCFVKDNNLIGISQRETSIYFDHIGRNKSKIIDDILIFFKKNIQHKFPSFNYIFDVYRKKEKHVQLLDFNPFGIVTDPLLFSWEELDHCLEVQDGIPEFRYVDENRGVQPCPLQYHAIPRDIVDISTGEDSFKFVDLMKLKIEQNDYSSSDTEEECEAEK